MPLECTCWQPDLSSPAEGILQTACAALDLTQLSGQPLSQMMASTVPASLPEHGLKAQPDLQQHPWLQDLPLPSAGAPPLSSAGSWPPSQTPANHTNYISICVPLIFSLSGAPWHLALVPLPHTHRHTHTHTWAHKVLPKGSAIRLA